MGWRRQAAGIEAVWAEFCQAGCCLLVLTNTSKLNTRFLFHLRPCLCRARSAGNALAPSGWPDGPGIPRLIVRCDNSISQHVGGDGYVCGSTMTWRELCCALLNTAEIHLSCKKPLETITFLKEV